MDQHLSGLGLVSDGDCIRDEIHGGSAYLPNVIKIAVPDHKHPQELWYYALKHRRERMAAFTASFLGVV